MFETSRYQNQDVGVGNLERSESIGVENFEKVELESDILPLTQQPLSKLWTFMKIWSVFMK